MLPYSAADPPFSVVSLLTGVSDDDGQDLMSTAAIDATSRSSSVDASSPTDDDDEPTTATDEPNEQRWQRTLRTFVQNTYRFHRQKIYDVLDHNYRHLAATDDDDDGDQPVDNVAHGGGSVGASGSRRAPAAGNASSSSLSSLPRGGGGITQSVDARRSSTWRLADNMAQLLGDGQFGAPTVALASGHAGCNAARSFGSRSSSSGAGSTFLYSFRSKRSSAGIRIGVGGQRRRGESVTGSSTRTGGGAADDDGGRDLVGFVFGAPLVDGLDPFDAVAADRNAADSDRKLSATVMTYFANFIRTGSVSTKYCATMSEINGLSVLHEIMRSVLIFSIDRELQKLSNIRRVRTNIRRSQSPCDLILLIGPIRLLGQTLARL